MKGRYSAADLARDDVAQVPDVYCPIPFDILPSAPIPTFPVRVTLAALNVAAQIIGPNLMPVAQSSGTPKWDLALPIGFYKLSVPGSPGRLFEVTGRPQEVVDVAV